MTHDPPLLGYFSPPSLVPCPLCLVSPLLFLPCPYKYPVHEATLTSCWEAHGEKTLSSSKDTGLPLCSRWMMESSSGSKVTALVASGPSPSSLVTGRTRAITRMFPRLVDGETGWINARLQFQADSGPRSPVFYAKTRDQRSISHSDHCMNSLTTFTS